jgi:hypothetical protein
MNNIKDKKVLIGMPCGSGLVPSLTVQSLLQLRKPCACAFSIIDRQRIDKSRNYFVSELLKTDFDYLMMIDDDNPIPPDTLEKFLEDDKDVVIAPIMTRNPNKDGNHDLCAYYSQEVDAGDGEKFLYYNFITKFRDEGPLHKIDAGGTGCILIKREVLETIASKYEFPFEFGDKVFRSGKRRTMSEDAEFTERCILNGYEVWLDDRIKPIHLGNQKQIQWQHIQ